MKNLVKLRELVLKEVDFAKVLLMYDVDFMYNPELVEEVQLRCPFHGKDNKPSARYYRETQSMFCWVCHKRWDIISFIMDMEHFSYKGSLLYIINKFQLDVSQIPDEPEFKEEKVSVSKELIETFTVKRKIREFRGKISFERYRALCSAYYMVMFKSYKDGDISSDINKLNNKIDTIKIG